MSESQISPSKRSAVQRLNQQCTQLREQLSVCRNEKIELIKLTKKQQGELKVLQMKYQVLQKQLQKQKGENHKYIEALQKQKKQKLTLMSNQQSVINNLNRDEVELSKLNNQNKQYKEQIQLLEKSLQTEKSERVAALRQKQNNNNKIKLLQTKLQSANSQLKYLKASNTQFQAQNKRLKQNIQVLEKTISQKQGPLQVQAIIKESGATTEQLLREFEQKIKEKQMESKKEYENYQRKNSSLNQRIIQLQAELLRRQ